MYPITSACTCITSSLQTQLILQLARPLLGHLWGLWSAKYQGKRTGENLWQKNTYKPELGVGSLNMSISCFCRMSHLYETSELFMFWRSGTKLTNKITGWLLWGVQHTQEALTSSKPQSNCHSPLLVTYKTEQLKTWVQHFTLKLIRFLQWCNKYKYMHRPSKRLMNKSISMLHFQPMVNLSVQSVTSPLPANRAYVVLV